MRLPSTLRIKSARDFQRVRGDGVGHPGRFLVLQVLRDTELTGFRFGIISPKKLGIAVLRNKIRRRLREIIRAHQHRFVEGVWLVVIARWRAPQAEYGGLERDWLKLAERAGILKPAPPPAPAAPQ